VRELEWLFAAHPPAESRIEHYLVRLLQLLTNINRDSKEHPEPFAFADFRVDWEKAAVAAWKTADEKRAADRADAWGDDQYGPMPDEPLTDAEEAEMLAELEAQHAAIYASMVGFTERMTPAQG
jgi:hypothetical protein